MTTATYDLADQFIAKTTPALVMPRSGAMQALEAPGHRFLVTQQGLHLEVRRDWIHAVLPLAASPVRLPFGAGPSSPQIKLLCGVIPRSLLDEFAGLAREAMPNEVAAWVIWNGQTGQFKLLPLHSVESSIARVVYERPMLTEGWHLVLDLHSHPVWPAAFSAQDDEDDGASGEVKLCGVLGHPSADPEWSFRLAACGVFHMLAGAHV